LAARKETRTRMKYKTITLINGDVVEGLVDYDDTKEQYKVKMADKTTKLIRKCDTKNVENTYSPFQKEVMDG
jgi:hypothetical protein